jgi:enamine deaminase RidA (YjgF/YER057c/UK114 family)
MTTKNVNPEMQRKNFQSGARWEELVGYSRAVKVGSIIEVGGTVAVGKDGLVGKDDAYEQTKYILTKIGKVLEEAGSKLEHVVRTRMYVTDISQWQQIGKAHNEFFNKIKPVTSMVEVKALISPEFLVEIEVTAILGE